MEEAKGTHYLDRGKGVHKDPIKGDAEQLPARAHYRERKGDLSSPEEDLGHPHKAKREKKKAGINGRRNANSN